MDVNYGYVMSQGNKMMRTRMAVMQRVLMFEFIPILAFTPIQKHFQI